MDSDPQTQRTLLEALGLMAQRPELWLMVGPMFLPLVWWLLRLLNRVAWALAYLLVFLW